MVAISSGRGWPQPPWHWTWLWELLDVWVLGALRCCWIRGCSTFTFSCSGPYQSSTRACLIHGLSQCSVTAATSQHGHHRAIPHIQRESLKDLRAKSTLGHPASHGGLSHSHITPPCPSHAGSCPGLATTVAPGHPPKLLSPGCFPSWSSK